MYLGHNIKEMPVLNDHNSRVYSGLEYIFIAPLTEQEKAKMIVLYREQLRKDLFSKSTISLSINSIGMFGKAAPKVIAEGSDQESKSQVEQLSQFSWIPIPIDRNKSKYASKTQGERYGKTYENTLTLFVKGSGQMSVEFFNTLINTEFAIIFKDSNDNYRLMFDECYNNTMEVEQDTGEGLAAQAGFSVTITNQSKLPSLYVYGTFRVGLQYNNDGEGFTDNSAAIIDTGKCPSENGSMIHAAYAGGASIGSSYLEGI